MIDLDLMLFCAYVSIGVVLITIKVWYLSRKGCMMSSDGRQRKECLISGVLTRSESVDWDDAKSEWKLQHVYFCDENEDGETCLCGREGIKEMCILLNMINENTVNVESECVKRYFDFLNVDGIVKSLRNMFNIKVKVLSNSAIEWCHEVGIINTWQHQFYLDIKNRMKGRMYTLTERQESVLEATNIKIIKSISSKSEY